MGGVTPEEIKKAREIDLLSYLQEQESEELVDLGHGNYTTRTHDSLKISNGAWMWFSRGFGGYNALDYLVKVRNITFVDAVKILTKQEIPCKRPQVKSKTEAVRKRLLLPAKNDNQDRVIQYLSNRGIDREIISYCLNERILYEEKTYGNAIFVAYDDIGVPRYASYRATNGARFLGDAAGSDKRYCFKIMTPSSSDIHIFESAIDMLSYATIEKIRGFDWRKESMASLAGVYRPRTDGTSKIPIALQTVVAGDSKIEVLHLHFDNDYAGKIAASGIENALRGVVNVKNEPPPYGKDYNDYLCSILGLHRCKERTGERENGKER